MPQGIQRLDFLSVWNVMGPEIVLVLGGFLLLTIDLFMKKEQKHILPWLGILFFAIAGGMVVNNMVRLQTAEQLQHLSGYLYVLDDFGNIFKLIFLVGAALTLLMSVDYTKHVNLPRGEYTYILMFGTVGAMVMASSLDLITIFVGLELLSIASYVLVGMRRNYAKSAEGAMKYLMIGAVGTALTLYGMSFVYGLTGTTNIAIAMDSVTAMWEQFRFLFLLSLVMMLAGFGIKISMVPFHMWTPDTYEGAPTPITAFLSAVSKAAGFAMLFRVILFLYSNFITEWYMIVVVLAILTMVIGNVAALSQQNMKRLMAYSSIAQAGYLLVPIAVLGKAQGSVNLLQSMTNLVFYIGIYVVMTMGAFAIISLVTRDAGNEKIDAFRGLYQRSPYLAIALTVFLLSMAGMPVTAGFFGKFMIILGAVHTQSLWLAGIMFAASVISFYYYFGVIRVIFSKETDGIEPRLQTSASLSVVIGLALLVTVGLGVVPDVFLDVLAQLKWFGPTA
ncbi:NADH-quinone oxidoreductase subunit N [Effusibacillus lacus]|uniref:NADH-quinone oxidoreductase subunit N n=1 Tax=Effusibacillus lacus TaxID=1348429 RepID=A0A292YCY9_9BACL|nr:NADH-quinone oxidoreductase subunit N [Effusibacillus lacus]TCS71811.1 NADH-quinone oxidoreductase subunit N [Effusibacillus lacus]GAX89622.1 NADH:ubiquinone oxidoreductase subunit N [Effusibacillus lacus]